MNGTNGVSVSKVAQIMDLYNFLPDMDLKKHRIKISDVNRPALQLSGFFEHFEQSRVQIIGNVEYTYLQRLDVEKKEKILQKFTTYDIPCIIFCRDLQPDEDFLQIASENDVPVLGTKRSTSEFMAELIFLANGKCDLKFHAHPKNFKRVEKFNYKKNFFKVYVDRNDSVYEITRCEVVTWKTIEKGKKKFNVPDEVKETRDAHLFDKIKGNPFKIAITKVAGEIDMQEL